MLIVGIDPDSEAHGVAIYNNGILERLEKWNISDVLSFLADRDPSIDLLFSIEDTMRNQMIYSRNRHSSKAAQSKIAMRVGRCQQSQVELERVLTHFGVRMAHFPPQRGNWADTKMKGQFEKATGWKGRSNADTRSAAFFGFLALSNRQKFLYPRPASPAKQCEGEPDTPLPA